MGVQGVGTQASLSATKGTVTDAVPGATALSCAVKLVPSGWLDTRATTFLSEMSAGPGQVPPDAALPPRSTMSEPTVAQTGVGRPPGAAVTVTVPPAQPGRAIPEPAVLGGCRVVWGTCCARVVGAELCGADDDPQPAAAHAATHTATTTSTGRSVLTGPL
jgi:hypothetical protein